METLPNPYDSKEKNPSSSPPLTPKSTPKSPTLEPNPNPYPTTFVQADTSSFKQVVQMLTGTAETAAAAANKNPPPPLPSKAATAPKRPAFKLYERRNTLKNLNIISPLIPTFQNPAFSPRKQPEILSPSLLDFPSLVLSPVTPLIPDPFNRSPSFGSSTAAAAAAAEERAIAEKGFYLHPSPRSGRESEPPRLLPLFPVTSSNSSSSSSSWS